MSKVCTKCNKNKEDFPPDSRHIDGLQSSCRDCINEQIKEYRRTKKGLITRIYGNQKASSRCRGHSAPVYTEQELQNWLFSQDLFHKLYNLWKQSGYSKEFVPSVDRLDDYKGYFFGNIKLTVWKDNNKKGHNDRRNGVNNKHSKAVVQMDKDGNEIKEYYSVMEASRQTLLHDTCISDCCNNKRKTTGGFMWKFVDIKNK